MSKVQRIVVTNLKAVSSAQADFNGCTAIITGGNNKGKSTVLRSLPDRIRGIKPDIIVKFGEKDGTAEWALTTGEKFIWQFSEAKEKLTFITKDNIKTPVTKEIAARFFLPVFDVDAFLAASPKKQQETLQKIAGIDFTEINNRYKAAYDERTYANRKQADEQAKVVQVDPTLPDEEQPVEALQTELAGIDAHNEKVNYVNRGLDEKRAQIKGNDDLIAEYRQKIEELIGKNETLKADVEKGEQWLSIDANKPKLPDVSDALKQNIATITEQNKKIINNNRAKEQKAKAEQAALTAKTADEAVKAIEQERLDMIKSAKLPEGFGFSDDGITYNNLPFTREQLSSSGIYIAALKLANTTLGEVRTLHFDASFLDKNSLADIEAWAKTEDLQLLIERPDFEGGEIEYQIVKE